MHIYFMQFSRIYGPLELQVMWQLIVFAPEWECNILIEL